MVTPTPADIAAVLAGKLHSGVNGHRCRCGACAHQVAQAARITGVPAAAIAAAVGTTPAPTGRGPRTPAPLRSQVGVCATVTVDGVQLAPAAGLAALAARTATTSPA